MEIGNQSAKLASGIPQVTQREPFLTGAGVIIAILDSGIDYQLDEFIDENGNSRILSIWDQTVFAQDTDGLQPPDGFREGVLYTQEQINAALHGEQRTQLATKDISGHGTAVAAIAAGNISGVATKAQLLIVKLGAPRQDSFPRTTQLMRGITYAVNFAVERNQPLAINLSFGNTYGDHRGESLLERFIDNASEIGKNVIIAGSGNEGASRGHAAGRTFIAKTIELVVATYETALNVQYWKHYSDIVHLRIQSPGGNEILLELERLQTIRVNLENTQLLCYIGEPLPYMMAQEIFIDFIPVNGSDYINEGVWRFELIPISTVTGEYRFYLPSYAVRNTATGFLLPTPEVTLTIPSTSFRAISVGAYNTEYKSYADFSGRGYVYKYTEGVDLSPIGTAFCKPDLVAPGVDITVPIPGGGYEMVSGTSFAAPFVTGSAALLMEYGIVRANDTYLYGQKLKASLIRGATKLPGYDRFPNNMIGWGALCMDAASVL